MARPSDLSLTDDPRPPPNRRSEEATPVAMRVARPGGPRGWLAADRLRGAARTLAWLVPLTILIWIYAERNLTVSTPDPGVPVRVTSSNTDVSVEFAGGGQQQTVNLRLSGPQGAVERVMEQLSVGHGLQIDTAAKLGPGLGQPVGVVDYVQNLPLFRVAGVTVQESQPATLAVNVERVLDAVDAVVEVDPRVANLLAPPSFNPPRVTLRGPLSRIKLEDGPDGNPRVYVDLTKVDGLQRPGDHPWQSVPVVLPVADDRVQVKPGQVSVKLQVRAADLTYVIEKVPIWVAAPPDTLRQFDVSANNNDPTLGNVTVTGPQKQIDQLQSRGGTFAPRAELEVSPADYNHDEVSRQLEFRLPDGVRVSPDDVARSKVEFKLTRRDAAGG